MKEHPKFCTVNFATGEKGRVVRCLGDTIKKKKEKRKKLVKDQWMIWILFRGFDNSTKQELSSDVSEQDILNADFLETSNVGRIYGMGC